MAREIRLRGKKEMSEKGTPNTETPDTQDAEREEPMQAIDFDTASEEEIMVFVESALDRLSAEGLTAVIEAAQDRRRERQEKVKEDLLAEFRERAASLGMRVSLEPMDAPMSGRGRRTRKEGSTPVAPKYRGPNGETWSGRGMPPKWLTALEATGRRREEFLIAQEYEV
jgi:DNA-binding protein H-NS